MSAETIHQDLSPVTEVTPAEVTGAHDPAGSARRDCVCGHVRSSRAHDLTDCPPVDNPKARSGVSTDTPAEGVNDLTPAEVTGQDGKRYPAKALGVSLDTVQRDAAGRMISPRGRCVRCGGPRGKRSRSDGDCQRCVRGRAAARRQRIAALTANGLSSREVAGAIGSTPGAVRVELSKLRHGGLLARPQSLAHLTTDGYVT